MKKLFLVLLLSCSPAAAITANQQVVNAAFAADQEVCYQGNDAGDKYVACVDKVQRCAAVSADLAAYNACKGK